MRDLSRRGLSTNKLKLFRIFASEPFGASGIHFVAGQAILQGAAETLRFDSASGDCQRTAGRVGGRRRVEPCAAKPRRRKPVMALFRPKFKLQKPLSRKCLPCGGNKFYLAGQCIRESSKDHIEDAGETSRAKTASRLDEGFNGLVDRREDRIRTVKDLADEYLEAYKLRAKSETLARCGQWQNHSSLFPGPRSH